MLTKEERAAIAERLRNYNGSTYYSFYKAVTDSETGTDITFRQDAFEMRKIILDLCDTSNMIELPLDKNGEVIRVGDTVYDKDGGEGKVGGYYYNNGAYKIIIPYGQNGCYINVNPNEIMHKKPVTIASLVERFKHVLEKGEMSYWAVGEICDIVDQLESLGDSDD